MGIINFVAKMADIDVHNNNITVRPKVWALCMAGVRDLKGTDREVLRSMMSFRAL